MTSYFSSMWEKTVGTSAPSTPAPVVAPENDAAVEEGALRTTLAALRADLDNAVTGYALPELDPWRTLLAQPDSRSEIVLRVLRYQTLNVTKAVAQVRAIIAWRAERRVCEIPATAMIGPAAGLPCLMVPAVGAGRRTLIFVKASAYVKKDVTLAGFETGLIRFFETLLYTADGMRASGSVVVVDFCDLSVREVDLAVTKRGIEIFLRYYPETFAKMLFVNFPRFIFHCTFCVCSFRFVCVSLQLLTWVPVLLTSLCFPNTQSGR